MELIDTYFKVTKSDFAQNKPKGQKLTKTVGNQGYHLKLTNRLFITAWHIFSGELSNYFALFIKIFLK